MSTETAIPDNPFTDDAHETDASSLARAIQEHLDLKQRNAGLSGAMPIDQYSVEDPFENHPLFKSEEQARREETLEGVEAPESAAALPWPGEGAEPDAEPEPAEGAALDEGLWGRSRDFDWGE
jgi:hypothetical protein